MEISTNTVYKLYPSYKLELELQDTEYPLSRESIAEFCTLKKEEPESFIRAMLFERPEEVAELLGIKRTPKLLYVDLSLKINYCVKINGFRLTYRDGSVIDSHTIFCQTFGRTPSEDDEFLELNGYEMHPHRKGKSSYSCFVFDTNKNFFIFPYRANTMQHTFITRGDDVFFAGTIRVINGLIDYIDDNSGHYRPNPYSILSVAYHFKTILDRDTSKIFTDEFSFENIKFVDSSEHKEVTFTEKETIRKEFLRIIEK